MFHKTIPEQVSHYIRPLLSPDASVVVAVSGGSDSVALLFLLHELRKRLKILKLVVAHVNHELRGSESDDDEQLVRRHATSLGIPFYTRRLSGHSLDDPGLEAWTREERYRFFNEIRRNTECALIATGHTLDDQAETVLMRITRGAGLNGLRGILPLRDDGVVRPLLQIKKHSLEAWLADRNIPYRIDRSNSDQHFFRNRIRHSILPQLESAQPGSTAHLAVLAEQANNRWVVQQTQVVAWIEDALFAVNETSFRLRTEGFSNREIASEGIRQLLKKREITPTRNHINGILSNERRSGGMFLLPKGWHYRCGKGVLYFSRIPEQWALRCSIPGVMHCPEEGRTLHVDRITTVPKQLDAGKWTVIFNGDHVGTEVIYRTVIPEDTFIPFGTFREVYIMKFLAKQGVPRPLRERTGILTTADNKPLWIHGIRLDERCRVTDTTKLLIKVQSESFL